MESLEIKKSLGNQWWSNDSIEPVVYNWLFLFSKKLHIAAELFRIFFGFRLLASSFGLIIQRP
jgi:hypothetical protein